MNKKIIHSVVEHTVIRVPEKVAIQEANRQITYGELNNAANRLAYLLRDLGVERNVIVGVLLPSSIDLVVSLLAIFKSGGIYLPMDIGFPKKKLERILQQCAPKVWITHTSCLEEVKQLAEELGVGYKYLLAVEEEGGINVFNKANEQKSLPEAHRLPTTIYANLPITSAPDDGNYIFYTSGSTGEPKAIMGCHKSLGHFINWEIEEFQVEDSCRVSQLIQATFDASLRDIFLPLCTGGTLVIPSSEVKSNTWKQIEWLDEQRITHVHYVPSLFRLIIKDLRQSPKPGKVFSSMRHFLLAGEMLYAKDVQQWRVVVGEHVELVNLYGPTETTMVKTFSRIREVSSDPGQILSVGKPMSHTMVAVINDGLACQVGEIGEIYIKTVFTTKGYLFDPDLHAKVFVQNPLVQDREDIVYKTGDLGRILASGDLEVVGRADAQVKINGVRVEIGEIEKAVLNLKGMEEVVIVLHTDEEQQASLVCYYTGVVQEVTSLTAALSEELNLVAMPSHFVHLEAFPLTINGKIDKKALPKPELLLLSDDQYETVANETERKLEAIWKEVLNLGRIGRKASFFAMGGTSLKAIKVISRIYKEFGVLLKVRDIFDYQTIEQLALLMAQTKRKDRADLVPIEPQEYYDISHAQKRLWIVDQSEDDRLAYNIPCAYQLSGKLDIEAFKKALHSVVERHESLRTTFHSIVGEPKQKIYSPESFRYEVEVLDLRRELNKEKCVQEIADQKVNQVFDLEKGPLFRTSLLRLEDEIVVFLFNIHHIISDAWTLEILTYEVLTCYHAYLAGQPNPLPALPIQFKDYAHWEKQQLQGENLKRLRQFWLNQFGDQLPVLEMPTDQARPNRLSFNGQKLEFDIEQGLTKQIQKGCQENGTTLFMWLLGAVNVLLYRYSGQKDIVVGIPIANREHKFLENQVGFYISTLAVRTKFASHWAFFEFLKEMRTNLLGLYEHAIYPLDMLAEEVNFQKDLSRNGLFDVMVQIQDTKSVVEEGLMQDNLLVKKLTLHKATSKFDLTFNFEEEDGKIVTSIEFNTDLYRTNTIEKMKEDLLILLESVAQDPSLSIATIRNKLLEREEKDQLDQHLNFVNSAISDNY